VVVSVRNGCVDVSRDRVSIGLQCVAASEGINRDKGGRRARLLSLLTLGAAMLAMGTSQQARAQDAHETKLPGITVEGGGGGSKKKAQTAPAPKQKQVAAPATAPAPAQSPATDETAAAAVRTAPYNVPASVSSVGMGELETFGQVNTGDVIRTIPGTYTRENVNNPGIAVNIRGFEGSGRVNMTIDGVRQDFRFTGHDAQGFAYVDPALLAGIDVQRGAVSTAGGAGALAGTANLRTLDVEDILKAGQSFGSLSSVTWGSNGVGWAEMASGAVQTQAVSVAGAISKRDQDDYKNGAGETVPFTDQDLVSGLFKAHVDIAPDQRLSFGTVLYDNDFTSNSYFQNLRSKIFTGNYSYTPRDNPLVNFHANVYGSLVELRYLQTLDPVNAADVGRIIDDNGWGFDITNVSRFRLGAVKVKSEYGYEYFIDDVDTTEGGVNPSGHSSISSAFQQTTFSLGIFDLIGGLRYDEASLNGSGIAAPNNPAGIPPGPYTVDRDTHRWNPKVTVAATPFPWLQPYVTYSESMRAPTVSEALFGGIHPGTVGINFDPNPFLDPEVQRGWEFGFNVRQNALFQPRDAFRMKADYYEMNVENYITGCIGFDPTTFTVLAFFCNNPGTTHVHGVELQSSYDAGYVFGGVTYTYTHTDLPPQINGLGAISYLPDNITTLTGGVRLFAQTLMLGARGYITGKSNLGASVNGGPPFLEGYELLDLFSNYKLTSDVNLAFTVTNVFDANYTPALSTPGTGGFTGDTGRGRTFLLTTRAQF